MGRPVGGVGFVHIVHAPACRIRIAWFGHLGVSLVRLVRVTT